MEITVRDLSELDAAAGQFLKAVGDRRVFAFHAPMGAGKTTFIAALCRRLGVGDNRASPTFSILNEYHAGAGSTPVYHFDFYRLEHPEEAYDIGVEDYFYSGNYCLIEWPDIVDALLPPDTLDVNISVDASTDARTITFNV